MEVVGYQDSYGRNLTNNCEMITTDGVSIQADIKLEHVIHLLS